MTSRRRALTRSRANATRWMIIRVTLAGQAGEALRDPPGRDLLASASHTFADLAAAIDSAFARWDLAHLHEFELPGGERVSSADDDEGLPAGDLDESVERLATLRVGSAFEYTFDIGAGWSHACVILRDNVDPRNEIGVIPPGIVPIFGWGAIPDQYGRDVPDAEDA